MTTQTDKTHADTHIGHDGTDDIKTNGKLDISKVNRSEVSRETGADLAHISRIFNLKGNPSLPLAVRISRILQVTVEELCEALDIPNTDLGAENVESVREEDDDERNDGTDSIHTSDPDPDPNAPEIVVQVNT